MKVSVITPDRVIAHWPQKCSIRSLCWMKREKWHDTYSSNEAWQTDWRIPREILWYWNYFCQMVRKWGLHMVHGKERIRTKDGSLHNVSHNSKVSDRTLIVVSVLNILTTRYAIQFDPGKLLWENLRFRIANLSASEIKAMHFLYVSWLMREPLNTDSCGVPGGREVEYPRWGYGQP
jgi:hypothetical protein